MNGKDPLYKKMIKLRLAEDCDQYGYRTIKNGTAEKLGWLTESQAQEAKPLLEKELAKYMIKRFGSKEEADKYKAYFEVDIDEEKYVQVS